MAQKEKVKGKPKTATPPDEAQATAESAHETPTPAASTAATQEPTMTETAEAPKAAKAKKEIVYTDVTMTDGRTVKFPGDQRVKKTVLFENGLAVGVQFDYRNGETRKLHVAELDQATAAYSTCHGLLQKIGDASSGTKEIDDIVLEQEEVLARLRKGDWAVEREAGDSMAGASIVIKAFCEATGKDVAFIKDFLDKKLAKLVADAEAAGAKKPTRQGMYASFRDPKSKVGQIIRRMEEEKASKSAVVDADAVLGELAAAGAGA